MTDSDQVVASPPRPHSSHHDLATYEDTSIGSIIIGPARLAFTGRVVNIIHRPRSSFSSSIDTTNPSLKASGYFKYTVSDGTGVIVVKHFYLVPISNLNLSTLVRIHATHVSPRDPNTSSPDHDGYFVSLFPERDRTVQVTLLDETIDTNTDSCRTPLGWFPRGRYIRGLSSVSELIHGVELKQGQVLRTIVIVKSIGSSKRIIFKKDGVERSATTVEILIRDSSGEAAISLWDHAVASARDWKVAETVLILSKPDIRGEDGRKRRIILGPTTMLEVDPDINLASELRAWAAKKQKEEAFSIPFPEEAFDIKAFLRSAQRIKFTLGEIDDFVRAGDKETYIGYFSLIVFETSLVKLQARNMLCYANCCGISIFSNTIEETCKSCCQKAHLTLNPGIIQTLSDETGSVCGNKLIWSGKAWSRLLGRSPGQLVEESPKQLRAIECALLYCRITLLIGWSPDVGRLAVCDVHI